MLIRSRLNKRTPLASKRKAWIFSFLVLSFIICGFYLKDILKHTISDSIVIRTHIKSIGIAGVDRDISIGNILTSLLRNISDSFGPKVAIDDLILDIKFEDLMTLSQSRQAALREGMLNRGHFDYVDSKMKVNGVKFKSKVRLKGWYLDHVVTDKWSLRAKTKGQSPLGIKEFSLNGPFTRDFHTPMLINEAMRFKAILAPREKFYDVTLNGKNIGNMYFEEQYSEQFTEHARTPYGPILKFDEKTKDMSFLDDETFWSDDSNLHLVASKMDRILEDPSSYRHLLNFDKWADYLAITFLFQCWHGNIDMNLSYYFHPLERSLQPISSDNSCGQTDLERSFGVLPYQNEFVYRLISVPEFRALLSTKLTWWLESEKAKAFLSGLRLKEISLRSALASESPFLGKFGISVEHLPGILAWLNSATFSSKSISEPPQRTSGIHPVQSIFPAVGIRRINDSFELRINDYSRERYVVEQLILESDSETRFISLQNNIKVVSEEFRRVYRDNFWNSDIKASFRYRDLNQASISKIDKVNLSYGESDSLNFNSSTITEILKYFKLDSSTSTFFSDNNDRIDISESLIIPENYSLRLSSGTKITFGLDVGLVVKGSLQIQGNKDQVVSLSGRDNDMWGGVLVIPDHELVEINYLLMTGGSGVIKGLSHRGAFTVNNAHVSIKNSIFQNNKSEDALNLVQVSGILDGLTIQNTPSDGLDVDYGDIELINSQFLNIGIPSGADAIDVSKTKIRISNVVIDSVTDKGVSIGENSTAMIENITISNALVGLVAKDSSVVTVNMLRLSDISMADTMAYRKKPHFKGSKILALNVVGGLNKSIAQRGSSISLNGSDIKPVKVNIGDLYGSTMRSIKK